MPKIEGTFQVQLPERVTPASAKETQKLKLYYFKEVGATLFSSEKMEWYIQIHTAGPKQMG